MCKTQFLVVLVFAVLYTTEPHTVAAQGTGGAAAGLTGKWILTADFYGTPLYFQMELKEEAGKLTGKFGGDKLDGDVSGVRSIL